uniref:Uncharacterized protein n=1 Tax=Arundo donax TaxID=35708 RepID=A0A0A9BLE3_ARUDO
MLAHQNSSASHVHRQRLPTGFSVFTSRTFNQLYLFYVSWRNVEKI